MDIRKLQKIAVTALEDIKGEDIEVIDTKKLTALFDRIIVATGNSNRQTRALVRSVHDKVKEAGGEVYGTEGEESGEWVLIDLGDIVVHVMLPAVRAYYNLEELWGEGKFDRPANPTSLAGRRLAHASEEAEPSLPHALPKPRSPATTRKRKTAHATTGAAPRKRKPSTTVSAAPRARRRKPAA
jgi:ribosome-associated protein